MKPELPDLIIKRPNGRGQFAFGWINLVIGFSFIFFGKILNENNNISDFNYHIASDSLFVIWLGGVLVFVGVFFLATAYILRALWFLSGDSEKTLPRD